MDEFELYKDAADGWRWRLKAKNGRIVADSGEAYNRPSAARKAIERLREIAPGARVIEVKA